MIFIDSLNSLEKSENRYTLNKKPDCAKLRLRYKKGVLLVGQLFFSEALTIPTKRDRITAREIPPVLQSIVTK